MQFLKIKIWAKKKFRSDFDGFKKKSKKNVEKIEFGKKNYKNVLFYRGSALPNTPVRGELHPFRGGERRSQAPHTFGLDPPSQLVIGY